MTILYIRYFVLYIWLWRNHETQVKLDSFLTSSPSPKMPHEHFALLAGLCSAQLWTNSLLTLSDVLFPPSNFSPKPSRSPGNLYTSTSSSSGPSTPLLALFVDAVTGIAGRGASSSFLPVPIDNTVTKFSAGGGWLSTLTTVTNSSVAALLATSIFRIVLNAAFHSSQRRWSLQSGMPATPWKQVRIPL